MESSASSSRIASIDELKPGINVECKIDVKLEGVLEIL